MENIKDPLFRFFEREVNAGVKLLADVRRDMEEVMLICQGEKKPTNHHRDLISDLAKGTVLCGLYLNLIYFNIMSFLHSL